MLSMLLLEVSANDGLSVVQHRADSIGGCAKLEHKQAEEQLCTAWLKRKGGRRSDTSSSLGAFREMAREW
jgi:hypothetical protein